MKKHYKLQLNTFVKAAALAVLMMVSVLPAAKAQTEDGTSANPFRIDSKQELLDFQTCMNTNVTFYHNGTTFVTTSGSGYVEIRAGGKLPGDVPAHFLLTDDIVVNEGNVHGCNGVKDSGWDDWSPIKNFNGIFDGDYHTISGLYCKDATHTEIGFFSQVSAGQVKNLGVVNSYFMGNGYVGGITGSVAGGGSVSHCFFVGALESNGWYCGGIAGLLTNSSVFDCYTTGDIHSTTDFSGGIVGMNETGSAIQNCYSSAMLSSPSGAKGGICGGGNGMYSNNYFDVQMTPNGNSVGSSKLTQEMTTHAFASLGTSFVSSDGFYPYLSGFAISSPAVKLSVLPIYLYAENTLNYESVVDVRTDFTVGTEAGATWTCTS